MPLKDRSGDQGDLVHGGKDARYPPGTKVNSFATSPYWRGTSDARSGPVRTYAMTKEEYEEAFGDGAAV